MISKSLCNILGSVRTLQLEERDMFERLSSSKLSERDQQPTSVMSDSQDKKYFGIWKLQ